jgi:hypothetical protein
VLDHFALFLYNYCLFLNTKLHVSGGSCEQGQVLGSAVAGCASVRRGAHNRVVVAGQPVGARGTDLKC